MRRAYLGALAAALVSGIGARTSGGIEPLVAPAARRRDDGTDSGYDIKKIGAKTLARMEKAKREQETP